jgi:hypothetical protein
MTPWTRRAWTTVAAFALGGLACLAAGARPDVGAAAADSHVDWRLPAPPEQELAGPDAVWKDRAPWGAAPVAKDAPPPPPPYLPVGVLATGRSWQAIFVAAGQPEVQLKPGDALPDGGKVTAVSRTRVAWTDREGRKREHQLLTDPLPSQNPNP